MSYATAVAGASGDSDRSDPKPASTNSTDKEDYAQACGTDCECHSTRNAHLQARYKHLRDDRDHYKLLSENVQLTGECQALENEAARYKVSAFAIVHTP